ncbi:geranylgeranyl reductase family protein [Candidatus Nanohalovita haloferacivicina]|uniref:geranylgeranyl reductase family protein n=1 Tax=Candidatus Nanohalovita haloferacivicina TaxID=2978046 RepID=UPI00325FB069|nr:Geranylgeranyl reductase family protein [Candidatus Nanohalobia archaeon BNXNv]
MNDLIIVGAGPVGSHLAQKMQEKSLNVLVIERSNEIGRPLACSGHVSPDIWNFVPEDARERLYQNEIKGANFHTESDKEYTFYKKETVSYVIDRVELDKLKAEEAQKAGAEYRMGETVLEVEEKEDKVIVETDSDTYEARMVAGCDGASSTVRSKAGLPEPDHFYQGILCFSNEKDSSDHVDVFLEVPKFFGWRIPRTDSVEYGAAVPKGENPRKWLNKVTDGYITEEEQENICAGAIPIGPPEKVTSERIFLAGDAAAQTKPFTGGGILYGMRAAEKAAETIDVEEPPSLEDYEKAWRKELLNDIRVGSIAESAYSWPEIIQRAGMRFFEGEIGVHMDRPTSLFSIQQIKTLFKR